MKTSKVLGWVSEWFIELLTWVIAGAGYALGELLVTRAASAFRKWRKAAKKNKRHSEE